MQTYKVDAKAFLNLDKKLIHFLKNRPYASDIANAANEASYKLDESGYRFETTWSVYHAEEVFEITVAGQMEISKDGDMTFLSYAFCVSRDRKVLRKYHYDYECSKGRNKPLFHIQYGGKLLPSLAGYDGEESLASWLSEPRLFYPPMSLVLVLDQAFLEFPYDDTERIRNDSCWKGHVTAAQREVLGPFLAECLKKIGENERLFEQCYV